MRLSLPYRAPATTAYSAPPHATLRHRRCATPLLCLAVLWVGCQQLPDDGHSDGPSERTLGQSEFVSAPPGGEQGGQRSAGVAGPASLDAADAAGSTSERNVEETDLYRLDGDRLYYLNGYRGLMVFDVSDIDAPRLMGRSPIFGWPVEMIVRDGIATVVVADWYGTMNDGSPFHGSIVRGIDARDPTDMRLLGEARLGGWVRDTRVVGDVLYAVSEEYGSYYGWWHGGDQCSDTASNASTDAGWWYGDSKTVVSSVSFAGGAIEAQGRYEAPGYGGIFHVTRDAVLFAHDVQRSQVDTQGRPMYREPTHAALVYIDISDPEGSIVPRGTLEFAGRVQSWGTDNGRWNLDFADSQFARIFACSGSYCGQTGHPYLLVTADFSDPDAPTLVTRFEIDSSGWSPAARFSEDRLYLSPGDFYWGGSDIPTIPIRIYDLSVPAEPRLAGMTRITGSIWNFTPAGDRLFALGQDAFDPHTGWWGSGIALRYLDVADVDAPSMLGTATFGEGWAWTPAAGTFKAFTKDDAQGLVVLPFSGWNHQTGRYQNGLQLIEFTDSSIRTAGVAATRGWVERGIFVHDRLVSLSNLALAVVDYTDRDQPRVVTELTLARNVVDAQPNGNTIAQLSSDWWDNDQTHSELRILPIDQADEQSSDAELARLEIDGIHARVFHDGERSYVVTRVREEAPCPKNGFDYDQAQCHRWLQQLQVVDRSGGSVRLRGRVTLPAAGDYWYGGWGWGGCFYYDWHHGDDVVQVGGNKLAFRRWTPNYDANGAYVDAHQSLFVADLSDPDAPVVGSTVIVDDSRAWWGNMRAIGNKLYTSHYEWEAAPRRHGNVRGSVRYYLSHIDVSDPGRPTVAAKINVPGMLVGGSETDPSLIYTVDYRWFGDTTRNEFNTLQIDGDKAYLLGRLELPGWVGNTFVRGDRAYVSVQAQIEEQNCTRSELRLYQLDLADPADPKAQYTAAQNGWGWLLGVEGDRALITSGWSGVGIDVYRLGEDAPVYDRFIRTLGWSPSSISRQDDKLFVASGHWGVQTFTLD